MRPDSKLAPPVCVESLRRYADQGIPTGGFLRAVLENNLRRSIETADVVNLAALPHIVAYIYNDLPAACWGSPAHVEQWLRMHRERREAGRGE